MTSRTARLPSRSSLTATRCAIAVLLTASAVAVQPAWAARLGHSRVVSAQNAPLQVLIPLTDLTPDERTSLRIAVADAEAWQRAGLKPPVSLGSMRLTAEAGADASQRIVRLTSAEVATDPAVDVLLSVGSGAGQRLVQLTVMQSAQGFPGLTSQATVGTPARAGGGAGGSVAVRQGDTLYGIAQSHALADATIYQMLVALWRANPQAFIGNNMNRVKAGARLVVPDASTVRAIDPGEARRIFLEQAEAYARYRAGLAGAAGRGTAAVPAPTTSGQVGSGAPAVQPDAGAQDRLRLSSGVPGQGAEAAAQSRADAETSAAKATQDARSRVDELERNVKDLNAALAQQGQGAGGTGAGAAAGGSGLTVTGLNLPGGPGAIAQVGQSTGRGAGANGQAGGGVAAGGQASAPGQAGGQAGAGGQSGANGQMGANGQPAANANAAVGAGGQPGAVGAGAGAGTGAGTNAGGGTGTGASTSSGDSGAAGQGATGQSGGNGQGNAGAGAPGANAGGNPGTGTDTANSAAGSANNQGAAGAAISGAAAGSGAGAAGTAGPGGAGGGTGASGTAGTGGAGGGTGASGTAGPGGANSGTGGANSSTGAGSATGVTGAGSNSGASSSNSGASTPGANPSGSAAPPSTPGSVNLGGASDADRAAGANGGNGVSAGGKAAQPTSALPRWLSDNLLIFMTLVLTLIAFVIAWLLRRAGARRNDDEDDGMDEDLYATEIDPAVIDRRLDGIDLDLDSKPTDASIRREPGVAPRNPVRS